MTRRSFFGKVFAGSVAVAAKPELTAATAPIEAAMRSDLIPDDEIRAIHLDAHGLGLSIKDVDKITAAIMRALRANRHGMRDQLLRLRD